MNDRQLKELILAAKGKLPFDIYFYNSPGALSGILQSILF